jgi:hypothetical protein
MKMGIIKSIMAISALSMAAAAPVQAQTWTDASGTSLPPGTLITLSGTMDISLFGWFGRTTCNVSIDGHVSLSSSIITLTHKTPGFWPNCDPDNVGDIELPIELEAKLAGGRRVLAQNVYFHTPVGTCFVPMLSVPWSNATTSEAVLPSNVTATPCTLHAGSRLRVTGSMAGNVSIN